MHIIDYAIFIVYTLAMLRVGVYFFNKNKTVEDFYVNGRNLSSWHIKLSVVATDVGGRFYAFWRRYPNPINRYKG